MELESITEGISPADVRKAEEIRERICKYSNPVEFVNDMYGCHPGDEGTNYFQSVFR